MYADQTPENDNTVSDDDESKKRKIKATQRRRKGAKSTPRHTAAKKKLEKRRTRLEENTRNCAKISKGRRNLNDMPMQKNIMNIAPSTPYSEHVNVTPKSQRDRKMP